MSQKCGHINRILTHFPEGLSIVCVRHRLHSPANQRRVTYLKTMLFVEVNLAGLDQMLRLFWLVGKFVNIYAIEKLW